MEIAKEANRQIIRSPSTVPPPTSDHWFVNFTEIVGDEINFSSGYVICYLVTYAQFTLSFHTIWLNYKDGKYASINFS